MNPSKNNMFLVYVLICVFLISIYSFSLENSVKKELNDYQQHLIKSLDNITNEYFNIQKKRINSFLNTSIEERYIEEFDNDEDGLIERLEEYEEYNKDIESLFIYYDDGRIYKYLNTDEDILSNDAFINAYRECKEYGNTVITDVIDNNIYIIRPLYTRDVTFYGTIVISISAQNLASKYAKFDDEKLLGDFLVSQGDLILYGTTDVCDERLIYNKVMSKKNNITISSNISYGQCQVLYKDYYLCKAIIRVICISVVTLIFLALYFRERIKIKDIKRCNVFFFILVITVQFTYAIVITFLYIDVMKEVTDLKINKINQYISMSEQLESDYNNAKFEVLVNNINTDLENYKLNEIYDIALNKYNKCIYRMMDSHESINGMMIVLDDSSYVIVPSVTLKSEIVFKEEWTASPYFGENLYYVKSDKFDENYRNIILSPIMYKGQKVGVIGYSILKNRYIRSIRNALNIDNVTAYLIDDNKAYMIKNHNVINSDINGEYAKEIEGSEIKNEKYDYECLNIKTLNSKLIYKVSLKDVMKSAYRMLINIIAILIMFAITLLCTCFNIGLKRVKEGNKDE